ncbi:MAG: nucleotidyl transferase AbiEii/AbiGii toxin family protein, partial [Cyanobacteria bacterium J06623_5]
ARYRRAGCYPRRDLFEAVVIATRHCFAANLRCMDSNRPLPITPGQALHQEVMRQVLEKVQDTPYVLKGGAALVFTRKLSRHSADLDFDSKQRVNLEGRLRAGAEAAGVKLVSLKAVKDTGTVQRYKMHYLDPESGQDRLLKVETSFRQPPNESDIETVDGIRTYAVGVLFDMKLAAAEGRTQARDLYDLAYLARFYGNQLTPDRLARAEAFTDNLEDLFSRYAESFAADAALGQYATPEDTAIALRIAVEEQLEPGSCGFCGVGGSIPLAEGFL